MSLRKFRAGRVPFDANLWVGEKGTIFYDEDIGTLRLADGVTPGGSFVYTNTESGTGNIHVNFAIVESNLYVKGTTVTKDQTIVNNIDTGTVTLTVTGNSSFIGNTTITGPLEIDGNVTQNGNAIVNGITIYNGNQEFFGNVTQTGNLTTTGNVMFNGTTTVNGNLLITGEGVRTGNVVNYGLHTFVSSNIYQYNSAVAVTGNQNASMLVPQRAGAMFHTTGQYQLPNAMLMDSIESYPIIVGRRYNGNTATPLGVTTNDIMFRLGTTPYGSDAKFADITTARLEVVATENQSDSSHGNEFQFWTTALGSNNISKVTSINSAGVTATVPFIGPSVNVAGKSTMANVVLSDTLNLFAGNTTNTSLKFSAGTNLLTPQTGAMCWDGSVLYFTPTGTQRGMISADQLYAIGAAYSTTPGTGAQQSLFGVGCTVSAGTRYGFSLIAAVTKSSSTNMALNFAIGGTSTFSRLSYRYSTNITNSALSDFTTMTTGFATGVTISGSAFSTTANYVIYIEGVFDVTRTGTFFPTIGWTSTPGTVVVQPHSFIRVRPVGTNTGNTNIGTWA